MAEEESHPTADDAVDRSLVADVRQLVDDGRTLIEAELAYQKSRALVVRQGAKGIALWSALAFALLLLAMMAVVLGLILTLIPALGPAMATLVVVFGLMTMGALSGWSAVRRWRRLSSQISSKEPPA